MSGRLRYSVRVTTVGDLLDLLEDWFPRRWAESWDNPGLQVGGRDLAADRVLCALDPTAEVVREAAKAEAGAVVTHHPLIFDPLTGVDLGEPVGRVVSEALRLGVAIVAAHTNADVARPGVTDALADALDLDAPESLVAAAEGAPGLGRIASRATTVEELVARCESALGPVRVVGPSTGPVERIALCAGSGATFIPHAVRAGAQVFITGDVKHHAALDAAAHGLTVIDGGHHATEWPFVPALAARLTEAGLEGIVSRVETDPFRGDR